MSIQKQTEYINLIQQNTGVIHKVIGLYVNNEEDRKDLYQEVLLQAWKSYKNFKGRSAFSTWLYKIALNTVLTFNKKQKRNVGPIKNEQVQSVQDSNDDAEMLYHIIKSFTEVDRMLITLHLDGYKNNEIAEITGITQNNIGVKIHRIKSKIIEKFKSFSND